MEYLASGFKNVDKTDDCRKYVNCLGLLHEIEFFKKYKEDSLKMLQLVPGLSVLDVGCGLGVDLIDIAKIVQSKGAVKGVDSSESVLRHAIANLVDAPTNIELIKGDALHLEFSDNTFDRCKIDRTLQHIIDPKKALSEIFRVLKPGGMMLAFDNDWETFTFSCTNTKLVRKVANYWCDTFASGWIGRYLYLYFSDLGLVDITVYPRTLVINDLAVSDQVFDLFQTVSKVLANNIITPEESQELIGEMQEQDCNGSFFSSYTGFIVVGRKPLQ